MISQQFLVLLLPLIAIRIYSYSKDIISRKIKPNLSSWFIWFFANLVSVIASLLKGIPPLEVSNTILITLSMFLVIMLSILLKQYYVSPNKIDIVCFALGIIGIILLIFAPEKNFAIGLTIIIDFVACFPTLSKIWTSKTESDNYIAFVISFIMATINLLVLTQFSFANSAFSFYKLFSTTILTSSVLFKNNKLKQITS